MQWLCWEDVSKGAACWTWGLVLPSALYSRHLRLHPGVPEHAEKHNKAIFPGAEVAQSQRAANTLARLHSGGLKAAVKNPDPIFTTCSFKNKWQASETVNRATSLQQHWCKRVKAIKSLDQIKNECLVLSKYWNTESKKWSKQCNLQCTEALQHPHCEMAKASRTGMKLGMAVSMPYYKKK